MLTLTEEQQLEWVYRAGKQCHVDFYFSKHAKNVDRRYKQSPKTFTLLTNVNSFVYNGGLALKHEGYIHIHLKNPHKNSRLGKANTKLVCLDVDNIYLGKIMVWFLENLLKKNIQDGRLNLFNKTEHGFHFFFLEQNPGVNRLWSRKTAIGITVDYLPSGFVTILGPGYQLVGHQYEPDFKSVGYIPWAFKIANKSNIGFEYSNGSLPSSYMVKITNVTSKGLTKHFGLLKRVAAKKKNIKSLKKIFQKNKEKFSLAVHSFLQCGFIWGRYFQRNLQPLALFTLLNEWGFNNLNKNSEPFYMGLTRTYKFVLVQQERICLPRVHLTKQQISNSLNIQVGDKHSYAKDLEPAEILDEINGHDSDSEENQSNETHGSKKSDTDSTSTKEITQTKFITPAEMRARKAAYLKSINQ